MSVSAQDVVAAIILCDLKNSNTIKTKKNRYKKFANVIIRQRTVEIRDQVMRGEYFPTKLSCCGYHSNVGKFEAKFKWRGKNVHCGYYDTKLEAAVAVDFYKLRVGNFKKLNFPNLYFTS